MQSSYHLPWLFLLSLVALLTACDDATASGNLRDKLSQLARDFAEDGHIPGVIIMMDRPEEQIVVTYGSTRRDDGEPLTGEETLRLGSITKTYIAALTLQLAEEDLLDLDAPASTYLPASTMTRLPDSLDPTIRQLLGHMSGIPDYYSERFYTQDWLRTELLTPELVLHAISSYKGDLISGRQYLIEANSEAGFHWPYYLTVPRTVEANAPILIEPNNDGRWGAPFATHSYWAAIRNEQLYLRYGRDLKTAVLTPVFPRPLVGDGNGNLYIHALTRGAILSDEKSYARPDLQLLAMLDDARSKLSSAGHSASHDAIFWGFSAASDFVTRMAVLHPERVRAVAAGGLGGLPILPLRSLQGSSLTYPLGVGDLETISELAFDADALRATPILLFQGSADTNDSVPEPPLNCVSYSSDSYDCGQAQFVNSYFGPEPVDRIAKVREIYRDFGMKDFNYLVLPGIDHWTPRSWRPVMLRFFECVIDGDEDCATSAEAPDLTEDLAEQANRPPR